LAVGALLSLNMNSTTQSANTAPLIILNSYGFSGAETLATFLAAHAQIGLLPGQNFIQQEHTLYRPISIPADDPLACFELLATKQYTKAGIQWAGLGKFMAPEYAARYSESTHQKRFIEHFTQLNDNEKLSIIRLIRLYIQSFFECMGDDTSAFSYYGFYGANLLLNSSAYSNFSNDTKVLQVKPSAAQWLSLASQARTWDPEKALRYYIIQNLFIALCERTQDNIHSISFTDLINNTQKTMDSCCNYLNIGAWDAGLLVSGQGHAPATKDFFVKIMDDAEKIDTIYANSFWYDVANSMNEWANDFLKSKNATHLLEKYQCYWNSTSHIAFDWSGPLENQLTTLIEQHVNEKGVCEHCDNSGIAYQFYQQWHDLDSINHQSVVSKAMYPLGELEADIAIPKLQYFMRIAINYIHASVKLQGEKLHSYHCAKSSHLYQRLKTDDMQTAIDRNYLRDAYNEMVETVNQTEALFVELKASGKANAAILARARAEEQDKVKTTGKITDEEIQAIAVSGPDISEHEKKRVASAMSDWYKQPYFYCEEFERRFADYHNRNYALMTPNCTSANHLLLMGLGIGPGDEVLVPEATWIASAAPTYYTGATPIYCDIDADDWCISIDSMKQNLSTNTRAIIVVNLYGNMAKMDELERFAKAHDLFLIEDAAESVGSLYKGRKSGEFGVGSVFSFHRTKTLTTGEGGMLLIDDASLYKRCVKLRDHGRGPDTPAFTHELITPKYMPFNVQAALGLGQLERLDELVDKKRHILHFYKERLAHFEHIQFNQETDAVYNSAWCTTIVLGESFQYEKAALMSALQARQVPSRPFFYPLSSQPATRARLGESVDLSLKNSNAFAISNRGINLPSALNLTDTQLDYVCTVLEDLLDADLAGAANNRNKAA